VKIETIETFSNEYLGLVIEPTEYYPWQEDVFSPPLVAHDGKVRIFDSPGWGVEINPAWLAAAEHRVSSLE
jgi:L-alanine-DL-glutamate epimerase-like enolase superfamily enzyme